MRLAVTITTSPHVHLRRDRSAAGGRAGCPVSGSDPPLSRGQVIRGRVPAVAIAQWPLRPALRADAARRDSLWVAVREAVAEVRAHCAHLRPLLWAFFGAPEPPVQLAEARGRARHPRRARHGADARDSDFRKLRAQHYY